MPRQRTHHSGITYVFPDDFPQRLKRFKEESGLSWAEIARRLGTYPYTIEAVVQEGDAPQHEAHDGIVGPGRRPGLGPPVHRVACNAKGAHIYMDVQEGGRLLPRQPTTARLS